VIYNCTRTYTNSFIGVVTYSLCKRLTYTKTRIIFNLKNHKNKFEFLRTEVFSMEIVLDGDDLVMVDDVFEQVLAKMEVQNELSN
jgi:hypothetical protein